MELSLSLCVGHQFGGDGKNMATKLSEYGLNMVQILDLANILLCDSL